MIHRVASFMLMAAIYGLVIVLAVRMRLRTDANGNSES